jgi:GNAT superfamily N-acetyltransferase
MTPPDARLDWRQMVAADLRRVEEIGEAVHAAYPEDPEVFAERLALFPVGCHVLERAGGLAGYVISHPWRSGAPPALNARLGGLPEPAGCYYIHDLALLPPARGRGVARRVVRALGVMAFSLGLPEVALVAVGGSEGFWRAQGFVAQDLPELADKLASYDEGARYMRRRLR